MWKSLSMQIFRSPWGDRWFKESNVAWNRLITKLHRKNHKLQQKKVLFFTFPLAICYQSSFQRVSRLQFLLDFAKGCLLEQFTPGWCANAAPELIIVLRGRCRAGLFHTVGWGTSVDTCSGKPEERFVKMFSRHVSRLDVGPIFNINQWINGSFVYAGAFITP